MTPNAKKNYNPDSAYVAELLEKIDLLQVEVAERIDVAPRSIRYWVSGERPITYAAQFCLEALAKRA